MVALDKTFILCGHCGNRTMEPRYVCPVCDWPRQHSEESAPPSESLPDGNAHSELAKRTALRQHLADQPITEVKLAPAPQAAPVQMAEIDLTQAKVDPTPRTLVLADDPPIDDDLPVVEPAPQAPPMIAGAAPGDDIAKLLADINSSTPSPKKARK